jgi:hypothetical protein
MRIDPRLLNWGLFFILLGAIPLAVRQGIVAETSVDQWWSLWPLLLVGAGVGLLLRRTPFEFAGGLLSAATLGVMGGSLLATGFSVPPIAGCGDERGSTAFETREGELSEGATVRIELNCGEVDVAPGSGAAWRVEGLDEDGEGPLVDANANRLTLRTREGAGIDFLRSRNIWTVTVPSALGVDLDLSVNAGRGTVDLGSGSFGRVTLGLNAGEVTLDAGRSESVGGIDVEVNAGSASVTLPDRSLAADLSVNAGSIEFCAPSDAGLRIRTNDSITAGNNFDDRGLTKSGSTWETSGYAGAAVQIEINAEANAGSFTLNPEGGCDA